MPCVKDGWIDGTTLPIPRTVRGFLVSPGFLALFLKILMPRMPRTADTYNDRMTCRTGLTLTVRHT